MIYETTIEYLDRGKEISFYTKSTKSDTFYHALDVTFEGDSDNVNKDNDIPEVFWDDSLFSKRQNCIIGLWLDNNLEQIKRQLLKIKDENR